MSAPRSPVKPYTGYLGEQTGSSEDVTRSCCSEVNITAQDGLWHRLKDVHKDFIPPQSTDHDAGPHEGLKATNESVKLGQDTCDSPRCHTPESSISDQSMRNHIENATPPESPRKAEFPCVETVNRIGRLSLDHDSCPERVSHLQQGCGTLGTTPTTASKRGATTVLQPPPSKQSTSAVNNRRYQPQALHNARVFHRPQQWRGVNARSSGVRSQATIQGFRNTKRWNKREVHDPGYPDDGKHTNAFTCDSGHEHMHSRTSTLQPKLDSTDVLSGEPPLFDHSPQASSSSNVKGVPRAPVEVTRKERLEPQHSRDDLRLILQPESSPISQDQLAAEVKGIYSGLVMVEARCISIDAAQAADPTSQLGPEQWQALIALHRTLLYEHHDFLMATQHPSATLALRGLAAKYSMPARMWKHGIHAFLEVLRHRRPESQDYMLAFIYLAYQMMALLFETVQTFKDTWIECLGDLARYRMAIEEEREAHTTWGGVAANWYSTASDRHPAVGRLNHHLGILERPGLRKFFLYAKALTCIIPFPNARDSLATLCGPLIQDEQSGSGSRSAEARLVVLHAQLFSTPESSTIDSTASDALLQLDLLPTAVIREIGVTLVITNVAALLELGSPQNLLWQRFGKAVTDNVLSSRPSAIAAPPAAHLDQSPKITGTSCLSLVSEFFCTTFNNIIRHRGDQQSVRDVLPSVHATLVWLHSLYLLRSEVVDDHDMYTCNPLLAPNRFSWGGLCEFLNQLTQHETLALRAIKFARQALFPVPEKPKDAKPLPEDYMMRGLIWTQFYFPSGWFNSQTDEEGSSKKTEEMHKARAQRVQWLGMFLAFRTDYIKFDVHTKCFWAPALGASNPIKSKTAVVGSTDLDMASETPVPASRSLATLSAHSDSEGYTVVAASKSKRAKTGAKLVSAPTEPGHDYADIEVFDDDCMQMET